MAVGSLFSVVLKYWPVSLVVALVAYLTSNYFNHGLNKYPGPLLAGFTDWWRFIDVYGRRPDITHLKLHRELGDIVRLGPNSLSFADPKAIKQIYGLNKGMTKVRTVSALETPLRLTHASPDFTQSKWQYREDNDCHPCSPQQMSLIMRISGALSTMHSR